MKLRMLSTLVALALGTGIATPAFALSDDQVKGWAMSAAKECQDVLEGAVSKGQLKLGDVFDRIYVPIPNTDPPKFKTRYDAYSDTHILPIEDGYLAKDSKLIFVVLVDKNGYLPSHNSKFAKPLTGDKAKDLVGNRSKRMFNDKTGISAARSTAPFLLQEYRRDTGEDMKDLSVPVYVKGKHWGAIRFGYKK